MWPQINARIKRGIYNHLCRSILATPPVTRHDDGVVIFSMIGTAVMIPYLVAVKSLHHHLRRGRIVIMDDGSLTRSDRAILRRHLDDPHIVSLHDIDVGPCPRGGTWERLLTILDMATDDYVIQLDSDTVTLGPVPHVEQAISANASFTLLGAETPVQTILPADEFTRRFFLNGQPQPEDHDGHIQGATESVIAQLSVHGVERPHYVRGCSGFTGFARGSDRRIATAFSRAAGARLGERWREWGTEQVTSSFVIANSPGARILPPDLYENFWGTEPATDARFLHFVGTYRWFRWEYLRRSLRAIRTLTRPTQQAEGSWRKPEAARAA
ncbi:MAG: glycosyltransferase family A protein [Sphingobium sp.]